MYVCTEPQLEVKWLTLSLVLTLEKRWQAATLSPAVFRANILASMFDTLKSQKHIFTAMIEAVRYVQHGRPQTHLELGLLDLRCCSGHLVLQEGQFCVRGATADAAGAVLQVSQGPLQAVHSPRSEVNLDKEQSGREQPSRSNWGATGGFVVYLLLHPGQLLVQPTSLRAAGDWRRAHGLGRRAALSPRLPDELLCSIQNLQNLCGDAAERRRRILLLYKKDTLACQVNDLNSPKKVK